MPMRMTVGAHYAGQVSWWLHGENRRVLAWAGRMFDSADDAKRAAEGFTRSAAAADFDIYEGTHGSWRWRARWAGQIVAVSANGFTSKQSARRAAENVKTNVGASDGP
jgi:uncharacterized protein YegP (UPF0339 family)